MNLLDVASFSPRSIHSPNAWLGHLPFAAWVIQEVSPKVFVELGTHSGNSYFSFCQSVAEARLPTKCFAVDTWRGDIQAGHYDDGIFLTVNTHNDEHYAGFSRLLRMPFDEATTHFADESIDLLHIDGLHTYDAVQHDFKTWLPKLAPGAVVLFHDIHVRQGDFGVWKLWEQLQARYPSNLEFKHSYGLGVIQLNNLPDDKIMGWLHPDAPEKERFIKYFGSLGAWQSERFEMNRQRAELEQSVLDHNMQIAALNTEIVRIKSSASWQITKPLRLIAFIFRRLRLTLGNGR